MSDIDRLRDSYLAEATIRFLDRNSGSASAEMLARDSYREEIGGIRTALSNLPPEDLDALAASIRRRAEELVEMSDEAERGFKTFDTASKGGLATIGGAFLIMVGGAASAAAVVGLAVVGGAIARLAGGEAAGLDQEGGRLRAAAEALLELAREIGPGQSAADPGSTE